MPMPYALFFLVMRGVCVCIDVNEVMTANEV